MKTYLCLIFFALLLIFPVEGIAEPKRIISEARIAELKKANNINEKKIQAEIRQMAIESLKKKGKISKDFEDK